MTETTRPKLLIVDDDDDIRSQMRWAFDDNYEVLQANDRPGALEVVRTEQPVLVTLDLGLPPRPRETGEGLEAIAEILSENPDTKVVVITGRGDKEHALTAIARGAYDFLTKPVDLEELRIILRRALHLHSLEREARDLRRRSGDDGGEMIGASEPMSEVYATIRKVATSDVPVLVVGETGTGKELVARAIHRQGNRREGPFVAINCGAIPENLLESELFGHERGAFTGAHVQRPGRLELARGGVLLLDEIGELSPSLQVKLLRYLQENKFQRVGGRQDVTVDARVVAATNVDLVRAIEEGRFRDDLYYRLSVVVIRLPPLRERAEDVLLLARALLDRYASSSGKRLTGFTRKAEEALIGHDWPGNVRELENRIKRAVIMAERPRLDVSDLELDDTRGRPARTLKEARDEAERGLLLQTLSRNRGNLSQVALQLGISRPTLYDLLEKHGISRKRV